MMKSTVLLICLAAAVGLLAPAQSKSDEQGKNTAPPKRDASDKFIGKEAGEVRDDNGLKMKVVWCSPGIFTMGDIDAVQKPTTTDDKTANTTNDDDNTDKPVVEKKRGSSVFAEKVNPVRVFLKHGYWLGKYEVTQAEWKQVMATEPWKDKRQTKEGDDIP